ncbi:MAG: type II toxin-antitoxin system prevent-host-death family antitoxin [Patescibacteria group bacterium]
MTLIPITKARGILGDLADQVQGNDYIILTKGGNPKVALVDIAYLTRLQNDLSKLYKKTFITPSLLPFTREFSDAEVASWEENDVL